MSEKHTVSYDGVIKAINTDYDDKTKVRLEVQDVNAPKPKKGGPGMVTSNYIPTNSHIVPLAFAKQLALGDKVTCTTTVTTIGKKPKVTRKKGF